jgi:MarR family transcriptional regulator, organic hydroperoxide resistance regulator
MASTPSPWETSPGFLLWHATLRWQREMAATLKPLDLTHVQFVLLAGTWWLGASGLPSQRELAEHCGTDVMMTSQVVRTLAGKGLLTREPDPVDSRIKRLRVTEQGRALAERAVEAVEAADRAFFRDAALPDSLIPQLRSLARPGLEPLP